MDGRQVTDPVPQPTSAISIVVEERGGGGKELDGRVEEVVLCV